MTRWFLIFLTSLLIVLGARYSTYSPLPTAVLAIAKLQLLKQNFKVFGNWIELIIMKLYKHGENSGFQALQKYLIHWFWRSQLYRIEQCGSNKHGKLFKNLACCNSRNRRAGYSIRNKRFSSELKETLEETFEEVLTDVKEAFQLNQNQKLIKL